MNIIGGDFILLLFEVHEQISNQYSSGILVLVLVVLYWCLEILLTLNLGVSFEYLSNINNNFVGMEIDISIFWDIIYILIITFVVEAYAMCYYEEPEEVRDHIRPNL